MSALHRACRDGDAEAASHLLAPGEAPPAAADLANARDAHSCTPLHWAADCGCEAAARLLLGAGAEVDATDGDGQTPLHYAALCERQGMARLLLAAGADAGATTREGETAAELGPPGWEAVWRRA